jgi:hypothetical protein
LSNFYPDQDERNEKSPSRLQQIIDAALGRAKQDQRRIERDTGRLIRCIKQAQSGVDAALGFANLAGQSHRRGDTEQMEWRMRQLMIELNALEGVLRGRT